MKDSVASSTDLLPQNRGTGGLVEKVVEYLRDFVARENLRPGSKLPSETKLSESLGVSRPVIREAMRSLAATGLIEMAVGKRAIIANLDGEMIGQVIENAVLIGQVEARNVLEMRRGIEISMVALAAERRTEADVAQLREIIVAMSKSLHAGPEYSSLDLRLHLALAQAAGNPLYVLLIEAFRQVFEASMVMGMERRSSESEFVTVQRLHETIVEAVINGDPVAARDAMTAHFDEAYQKFWTDRLDQLARRGQNPG